MVGGRWLVVEGVVISLPLFRVQDWRCATRYYWALCVVCSLARRDIGHCVQCVVW